VHREKVESKRSKIEVQNFAENSRMKIESQKFSYSKRVWGLGFHTPVLVSH
jgi:hypothetical protein